MEDLQVLDYERVEQAYRSVLLDHAEMIAFSVGLGLMFAVFNLIRSVKDDVSKDQIDYVMILKLVKDNIPTMAMIIFLPIALTTLEAIMGTIQESYMGQMGNEPQGFIDNAKKELTNMFNEDEELNIFSIKDWGYALWKSIEFLGIAVLKPFFILIDQWSYGFALVYRFIYLGLLKMVSGVAIACMLYEPTRHIFITFVKNLIICYLLIPGFLFVTTFVDLLRETFFQANIEIGIIIMMVFLKILGYGAVHKFLQSSI